MLHLPHPHWTALSRSLSTPTHSLARSLSLTRARLLVGCANVKLNLFILILLILFCYSVCDDSIIYIHIYYIYLYTLCITSCLLAFECSKIANDVSHFPVQYLHSSSINLNAYWPLALVALINLLATLKVRLHTHPTQLCCCNSIPIRCKLQSNLHPSPFRTPLASPAKEPQLVLLLRNLCSCFEHEEPQLKPSDWPKIALPKVTFGWA